MFEGAECPHETVPGDSLHDCRLEIVPQIPKSDSDFSPKLAVPLSRVIMSWMDELDVSETYLVTSWKLPCISQLRLL